MDETYSVIRQTLRGSIRILLPRIMFVLRFLVLHDEGLLFTPGEERTRMWDHTSFCRTEVHFKNLRKVKYEVWEKNLRQHRTFSTQTSSIGKSTFLRNSYFLENSNLVCTVLEMMCRAGVDVQVLRYLCWCVDVRLDVLMCWWLCWCVEMLRCWLTVLMAVLRTVMCWGVDVLMTVLMCWGIDVDTLACWSVDDCVDAVRRVCPLL
jgi:hypothetical protein